MPQYQMVDMTPKPADDAFTRSFLAGSNRMVQNARQKQERDELRELYSQYDQDVDLLEQQYRSVASHPTLSPTSRVEELQRINEMKKMKHELNKESAKKSYSTPEEREKQIQQAKDYWDLDNAAANFYVDQQPGVQQRMAIRFEDEMARRLRNSPQNAEQPTQQEPTSPEIIDAVSAAQHAGTPVSTNAANQGVRPVPQQAASPQQVQSPNVDAKDWPIPVKPEGRTPKELVQWEEKNRAANHKELKIVEDRVKNEKQAESDFNILRKVNEKIPDDSWRYLIDPETRDIRDYAKLAGKVPPEIALYSKLIKRRLVGAKEQFGARVTNFDAGLFLDQLPTLLENQDSRRLLLNQMKIRNELDYAWDNEMKKALQHYGGKMPYNEISALVDERVYAQQADKIKELENVVEGTNEFIKMKNNPEKYQNSTLMYRDGEFRAVDNDKIQRAETWKWRRF